MMPRALTADERSRLGIGGFVVPAADVPDSLEKKISNPG